MNTMRVLYHLARADFLERVRRYSFLITLGLTVYIAYVYMPPVDAAYLGFSLGGIRGAVPIVETILPWWSRDGPTK